MIKDKNTAYILFIAVVTVFWTLFDIVYSTLITHSGYSFRPGNLLEPLLVGIILGYLLILRRGGARSAKAARILRSKGYTKAESIGGADKYKGDTEI